MATGNYGFKCMQFFEDIWDTCDYNCGPAGTYECLSDNNGNCEHFWCESSRIRDGCHNDKCKTRLNSIKPGSEFVMKPCGNKYYDQYSKQICDLLKCNIYTLTAAPTRSPTKLLSISPSYYPTKLPSISPMYYPSELPSNSMSPSYHPTDLPSVSPIYYPTDLTSISATYYPTKLPPISPIYYPTSRSDTSLQNYKKSIDTHKNMEVSVLWKIGFFIVLIIAIIAGAVCVYLFCRLQIGRARIYQEVEIHDEDNGENQENEDNDDNDNNDQSTLLNEDNTHYIER